MITVNKANPTPGEITSSLTGSTGDGAGLHFDGSGVVAATPVNLGSKFSHEFVISTSEDLTAGSSKYIIDYHGAAGRFIIGVHPTNSNGNIAIFDRSSWVSFGVNPLTDLKVHHLVVTVSGTSAVLYDNGNEVATATINAGHNIWNASNVGLGGYYNNSNNFEGTIYRARTYNKALTSAEVQTAYERADVGYADQYGRQAVTDGSAISTTNWTNGTGWTFSPSNKATYTTGSGAGALSQTGVFTSADAGKNVRITFTVENVSSGSPSHSLFIGNAAGGVAYKNYTNYGAGTHTAEFTMPSGQTTLGFWSNGATFTISNISVHVEGCVSDYQTQWANPSQSLTVQDASGAADGTCSASGVTQVQPVIQGNLTSLAVTTSQQAAGVPADGAVVADNVGIGVAPDVKLAIKDNVDNSNESGIRLLRSANSDCGWINMRGGAFNINTRNNAANAGLPVKVKMHGSEVFTIASDGNIEQHTDTNGITKFVVKNENTGTSARALVQAVSDGANMDLWANSASYTGVAGWADSGVISTGSTTSGGMKINAVAGGLSLQTNQTARLTIANSTGLATFSGGITVSGGFTNFGSFVNQDISGGAITATSSTHKVDTEGGAGTDDLDTINGGTDGSLLILMANNSARTVVVKDGTNLRLAGDFSLDDVEDTITLIKQGSTWKEVSRSNNA